MDLFLAENPVYQNFLKSEVRFLEHQGDLGQNFLTEINPIHVDLYLYLNRHSEQEPEINKEILQTYLDFLDKYQYPDDDFLLFYLKYPDLEHEKLDKIREEFQKLDPKEFRLDSLEFLRHICRVPTLYLKVFKMGLKYHPDPTKLILIRHLEILKFLNVRNEINLKWNIRIGNLEVVKYLLTPDMVNDNLLQIIYSFQRLDILKYLIEAEIIPANNNGLLFAVRTGNLELVKYLVEQGVDIHRWNEEALKFSASFGHLEIFKYLIEQGADLQTHKNYILTNSAYHGHLEILKYLTELDVDIKPALADSIRGGQLQVVKYLVEHGANIRNNNLFDAVNFIDDDNFNNLDNRLDIIKYLVEQGVDVHFGNEYLLRKLAILDNLEIIKFLIAHGADIYSNNEFLNHYMDNTSEIAKYFFD